MASPRRKPRRRSGGGKKRAASGGSGSTWLWGGALVALVAGIAAYDNSADVRRFAARLTDGPERSVASRPSTGDQQKQSPRKAAEARPAVPVPPRDIASRPRDEKRPGAPHRHHDGLQTAGITPPAPVGRPDQERPAPAVVRPDPPSATTGRHRAKFYLCGTAKQDDCVIAGDSFMFHGEKIRLAGIEVPDIDKPRCEAERIKASDAELRVRAFLDSGPFELVAAGADDADSKGRKVRAVMRNGVSLSDVLVREGLARRPGSAGGWC